LSTAKSFTKGYPVETDGKGLLFAGSKGVGKTFLAVSILKSLIAERGASGVFWEHKELMENLRGAMFGSNAAGTEDKLLRSVTKCDILVLDDLGDLTPSDWTWDTTSYILNSRYNENLSTIITTNLDNRASLSSTTEPYDRFAEVRRAAARLTLGDRIGDRMWSRLQEMCVVAVMQGEDYRLRLKRASFAGGIESAVTPALQSAEEAVRAALETLRAAAEEEIPSFGKAIHEGAPVGPGAMHASVEASVAALPETEQEKPVVGADRLGKWAAKNRLRQQDTG
jgi:DNA replication protein DnaC